MKKILIALALFASVQVANAQNGAAAKAVEAALAATQNEKKAAKMATWLKLAETYVQAYDAPAGNVWLGAGQTELQLAMGNEKPVSTETVVLNGSQYTKQVFADKNLYLNASGVLEIIEVTKPVVEDALPKALEAYKKAHELDPKGSKSKDISEAIAKIAEKMTNDAYSAYSLGDIAKASEYFEAAVAAAAQEPNAKVDTSSLYNAAFTSWSIGNYEKAKGLFEQCLDYGYYSEGGEVYSKLADCAAKIDTSAAGQAASKAYLEEGFTKFPGSQSLLIGLINYYVTSGEDSNRLFELLDDAKKNEPNNASLYYVEGNIRKQLGQFEEAAKAYQECSAMDPNYEFGHIGEGIMYYEQALDLQTRAQEELDDNKYMALVQEFEVTLKKCIDPFEKAYEITKDDSVKSSIAEYLKNVYYRFRDDEDPKYNAGYEKYNALLQN